MLFTPHGAICLFDLQAGIYDNPGCPTCVVVPARVFALFLILTCRLTSLVSGEFPVQLL